MSEIDTAPGDPAPNKAVPADPAPNEAVPQRTSTEAAAPAGAADDWSARATSTFVGYVDTVRGATTGKALVASRIAVYGVAAALVAMVMMVLLLIAFFRFLVVITGYWDYVGEGGVWLAYWILGAIFLAAGAVIWRLRGN